MRRCFPKIIFVAGAKMVKNIMGCYDAGNMKCSN